MLVFVKSSIPSFPVKITCSHEITCVRISLPSSTVILTACYRAPDSDSTFVDDLCSVLSNLHFRFPNAEHVVCGDFNFPDIDWNNLYAPSRQSNEFLDMVLTFNLMQTVKIATRGTNILDLILVSNPDFIRSLSCVDFLSDHKLLLCDLSIPIPMKQPSIKYIRSYKRADFAKINSELNKYFPYFLNSSPARTIDQNWLLYKNKILSLIDAYVPLIRIRGDARKPWYSNTLRRLSNKKKRLYREAKNSTFASKWQKYLACLHQYTRLLRHSKKKFFHQDLKNIIRNNPKKFWSILAPHTHRSRDITLFDERGASVPTELRSDTMNSYFSSVFTHEPPQNIPPVPNSNFPQMPPIHIAAEGIVKIIDGLKTSKAPGPDGIPAKFLKSTKESSSLFLQVIFEQSLTTGLLPKDWKISKVVPVFKAGNRSDPSNYRPISLTCIACKLLEHVIYSHVASHLDQNNFFFTKQHGFRSGFSCETQLFEFTTDLHLNMDSSFQTDIIFLDFSKAFDRVPHLRLMSKLSGLSIDPLVLSWIHCFLTGRSQYTVIDNHPSALLTLSLAFPKVPFLAHFFF